MKLDFIPFQLGEHYESWEFELKPYKTNKYIDEYIHIKGHLFEVVGLAVKTIYLGFNADVLCNIRIEFEINDVANDFIYLIVKNEEKLGNGSYIINAEESKIIKQWQENEITLKIIQNFTLKTLTMEVTKTMEFY